MAKPFNALVSQVMHNTSNALRIDTGLQRGLVSDDLVQTRADLLRKYAAAGKRVAMSAFSQTLPALPLEVADFSFGATLAEHRFDDSLSELHALGLPVERLRQFVRLPELLSAGSFVGLDEPAVEYVGAPNGVRALQVFTGSAYQFMQHRRYTGRQPFVCIINGVAWVFTNTQALPYINLPFRGVLADPRDAQDYGAIFDLEETPFPAPTDFAAECVQVMTNKYISMYGRAKKGLSDGNNLSDL